MSEELESLIELAKKHGLRRLKCQDYDFEFFAPPNLQQSKELDAIVAAQTRLVREQAAEQGVDVTEELLGWSSND